MSAQTPAGRLTLGRIEPDSAYRELMRICPGDFLGATGIFTQHVATRNEPSPAQQAVINRAVELQLFDGSLGKKVDDKYIEAEYIRQAAQELGYDEAFR